jgi:hypothetical protein
MGVATFLLLLSPALAAGGTMADAARKAKEAREKNAKAGVKAKSYTQEDVKDAPPLVNDPGKPPAKTGSTSRYAPPSPASGGSTVTASELVGAARAGSSSPGPPPTGGQSESAWRARVAQAQRRIEDARKVYEYWNSHTLVRGEVLVDEKGRTVIGSIEELQGKTAAARRALEGAERALANLEEEARRAGVPPGWLR